MGRRTAREVAMKMAYARIFNGTNTYEDVLEQSELSEEPTGDDLAFINRLLSGVSEHQAELDGTIGELSIGWEFERIANVDKCILRIAMFEMLYSDDVSDGVAINEAVELAKRFGDDNSSTFVNGILGTFSRRKNKAEFTENAD